MVDFDAVSVCKYIRRHNKSVANPGFFNRAFKISDWIDLIKMPYVILTLSVWTDKSKQTAQTAQRTTRRLIRVFAVCHSSSNFRHIHRLEHGPYEFK